MRTRFGLLQWRACWEWRSPRCRGPGTPGYQGWTVSLGGDGYSDQGRQGWLETEWSEGQVREAGRSAGNRAPARVAGGSQSAVVARKRGNARGAKGRRKVDARWTDEAKHNRDECLRRKRLRTKQAGEIRARWAWAERSVWTDRMLTALENGVKGGKWFSLMDKVSAPANLFAAYAKVAEHKGAPGVDHVTVEDFGKAQLTEELERLAETLAGRDATVRRQVRRVWIPKPGSARSVRWGSRRCAIGWCRRRCGTCWSRSSSGSLPSTATAFARDGGARTRCGGWTRCCKRGYTLRGGRGPEELLRHDPARRAAGHGSAERVSDGRVLDSDAACFCNKASWTGCALDARRRGRRKGR